MDCLLGFIDSRVRPAPSSTHRPPLTRHLPEDLPSWTPATPPPLGPAWTPEPPAVSRAEGRETAAARVEGSRCGGRGRGRAQPAARGTCVTPQEKLRRPGPTARSSARQRTYPYTPRLPHPFTDGWTLPGGSVVKNSPANAGDAGLIPAWGRSPAGRHGNALQRSCLENPMDRGAWQATAHDHGVTRRPHD